MNCGCDIISIANLALCVGIFIIGCLGYSKTKKKTPFYIGAAFGLFAVSHLITLMGVERSHELAVILIRIFGYTIVAMSLYQMNAEK